LNVIEIAGLRKSYGQTEVLHGIDLTVRQQRLTGFLGPNGAGKTTTIRILLGLIQKSGGTARLFGEDTRACGPQLRKRIGYLPADVRFPAGMSGLAVLQLYADARRVDCKLEIRRLAGQFDLNLDKRVRKYSTGMKQKLGLIQALMHRPELLILDEPTSGLDPLVRESVFRELRDVVASGRTILFSSHSLGEVEQLCDDVIILRDGNVIENQPIDALRQRALRRITIEFLADAEIPDPLPAALQIIKREDPQIQATWADGFGPLIEWLGQLPIRDATIEKPDLEDLFLTYYGEQSPRRSDSHGASD
jgi:ABC-2 type transport system ATP-binding protein